jgi:hypothetical protein
VPVEPAERPNRRSPSVAAIAVSVGLTISVPAAFAGLALVSPGSYLPATVLVGLVLTAMTRMRWPKNGPWMAVLGVLNACGLLLVFWLTSPLSSAPDDFCSDCEDYLGHSWEPSSALNTAIITYLLWLASARLGIVASRRLRNRRGAGP